MGLQKHREAKGETRATEVGKPIVRYLKVAFWFRTWSVRLLLDTKRLQQFNDFPISFAIKARVIFEVTGQSALRTVHGACCIGASLNQSPDDPRVPMHNSGVQRRRTVVLLDRKSVV